MTHETAISLKNFFNILRTKYRPHEILYPLSPRTFESLIRLAQARAKLACRNVVIPSDIDEIKDLFTSILLQSVSNDESNARKAIDRTDISKFSIAKQTKVFIDVLNEECKFKGDRTFSMLQLRDLARSMKMSVGEFHAYVDKLNQDGHFLKKGDGLYTLLTNTDI